MSYLKSRMEGISRSETVHIDSLDVDAEIRKITLRDARELQEAEREDPVQATLMILSRFVLVDGEPMADPDDAEAVEMLTADIVGEIAEAFAGVNGQDLESLKKKAGA